jgi:hypothetical protein
MPHLDESFRASTTEHALINPPGGNDEYILWASIFLMNTSLHCAYVGSRGRIVLGKLSWVYNKQLDFRLLTIGLKGHQRNDRFQSFRWSYPKELQTTWWLLRRTYQEIGWRRSQNPSKSKAIWTAGYSRKLHLSFSECSYGSQ